MLMISDLIDVARGQLAADALIKRANKRFEADQKPAPVVVWNVCFHCNMTCPHCYAAAGPNPSRRDLSTDEAITLLDDLAANGIRIVIFSGGEPLLRPDLPQLMAHAQALGLSCHLSTNGTLIDDDKAEELAALGIRYVGISIDGNPDFNDDYRGLEDGYELAMNGVRAARRAGMKTGIRITITRRNRDQVNGLLDASKDVGADRFYISHLVYAGRAQAIVGDDLAPEDCRAMLLDLFETAEALCQEGASMRLVSGGNDSDGPLLLNWLRERYGTDAAEPVATLLRLRGGNSAGEGIINIDHAGNVHPDQFWRQESFGNVRRDSVAQILAHPLRETLANRAERLTGRCGECQFKSMCRGSHRERAVTAFGDMFGPDPSCVMRDEEIGLCPQPERGAA